MTTERRNPALAEPWAGLPATLRKRGLRWTPQRRLLIEVLSGIQGHVIGADLVERCRRIDPETTPSTVYRTLDVLEELGLVRHCHGADGREEYHVLPAFEHGHLFCETCGAVVEIAVEEARTLASAFAVSHDFEVDLSHVTIVGRCGHCRAAVPGRPDPELTR